MNCPKCHARMAAVSLYGIEIDRCSGCKGLWFDNDELDALGAIDDSEMLDLGLAAVGHQFNAQHNIDCPRCEEVALMTTRINGGNLTVEQCPQCQGRFLDAGEFTAYKYHGPLAPLRTLVSRLTG